MRWQYFFDNHLQVVPVAREGDAAGPAYATKIGECDRAPLQPIEEAALAARLIARNFGPDLVLCMSGGVDSEAMALSFLRAGVPFRVAVGRYMPKTLNDYDIARALGFCNQHGLAVEMIDIDLLAFFESGRYLDYGRRYLCRSPQLAIHIHILEFVHVKMKGVPVMSGNPIEAEITPSGKRARLLFPSEPHLCYLRYLKFENRPGVPFFFMYTPELVYSFWNTPQFIGDLEVLHRRLSNGTDAANPSPAEIEAKYQGKIRKYQEGGYPVLAREAKMTGFEKAKLFFREHFMRQGLIDESFPHEPFDYFYRRPLEALNPYPEHAYGILSSRQFPRPEILKQWL